MYYIEKCAPNNKYEQNSCFTIEQLKIITNAYNKNHPDQIEIIDEMGDTVIKGLNDYTHNTL